MSASFDPQFHTRIAQQGQRSVWLAAPLPDTVLPQKTARYRAWRAEECRRLRADGDIVLSAGDNVLHHSQPTVPFAARAETACA